MSNNIERVQIHVQCMNKWKEREREREALIINVDVIMGGGRGGERA